MTVSPIPSYARRWPFETGRPASVLTRKALSRNHKIWELGAQLPVEQRLANPKALTARPRTTVVRVTMIGVGAVMVLGVIAVGVISSLMCRRPPARRQPARFRATALPSSPQPKKLLALKRVHPTIST